MERTQSGLSVQMQSTHKLRWIATHSFLPSLHCSTGEECICRDWHGCIMSQKIVGLEDVQPYKFSECSKTDYIDALRMGHGLCLLNKPNEVRFVVVVPSSSVELLAGALAS